MKKSVRALLRRVATPPFPPPPLHSEEAYREWLSKLSDDDLERERARLLSDDQLLAELDRARREELQEQEEPS